MFKYRPLLFILLMLLAVGTWGCGSKSVKQNSESLKGGKYYAVGQTIDLGSAKSPEWIDNEGGIIEHEGEKYAWIKGEGSSKNKVISKKTAIANAQSQLSQSFKVVVANQFAQAWDTIGDDEDKESIEQVKQGLTAVKTRTTIKGFNLIKSYNTQTGKIKTLTPLGKPESFRAVRWRYIVMMGMPYELYIKHRDELIDGVSKTVKPNSRQKKLIKKVEEQLKKLDEEPKDLAVDSDS